MVPVFKNVGEMSTAKNYSTVSLLSVVVSKVFEKSVIGCCVINLYVPFRVGGVFPLLVKINNKHIIQLLLIKVVVHYIGHYLIYIDSIYILLGLKKVVLTLKLSRRY